MRLLDVHKFPPPVPENKFTNPPYAILSHVWEENELTFSDLFDSDHLDGIPSGDKIRGAQQQAVKDRLDHIWIDTLCIDKSSSAELGEAINSMYRWYQDAEVCYVYLADIEGCPRLRDVDLFHGGDTASKRYFGAMFRESRWFKRGWTLQELIAPSRLRFYDKNWNLIGSLRELAETVSEITGIHLSMLQHLQPPEDFSIAQRMCWAAGRKTTRPEDRAYSLLGILDMSIDIRYGEGTKAFTRLQEAIIEQSADQSIFAWEKTLVREEDVYMKEKRGSYLWCDDEWTQLLAPSPDAFSGAQNIVPCSQASLPYRVTNMGLHITARVVKDSLDWMILNCYDKEDPTKAILLNLRCDDAFREYHSLNTIQKELTGVLDTQQKEVIIAHVWLHERCSGQQLSPVSRLSFMDADQAMRQTRHHELLIAKYKASKIHANLMDQQCSVWLQLLSPEGARRFSVRGFKPKSNRQTSNLTWTLERDYSPVSSCPSALVVSLCHPSGRRVELRLAILEGHGYLGLESDCYDDVNEKLQISTNTWNRKKAPLPLKNHFQIAPDLTVTASLHCELLNGQKMYVAKVWPVQSNIRYGKLKSVWRILTGGN